MNTCSFNGCDRKHEARGLCHSHFEMRRRGRPLIPILDTPEKRFMAKVSILDSGHWIWNASKASEGRYGAFYFDGRVRPAHVASWLMFRGQLHDGTTDVDHLCRKTLCVNPEHLEPKTHRQNVLVGDSFAAHNAAKTQCIRGHDYTPENTIRKSDGGRNCRACWDLPEMRLRRRDSMRRRRNRLRDS